MIPFPNKKYQIIYADPPWEYGKALKWDGMHGKAYGPEHYYKTMSLSDIQNLIIPADENAWLILWATASKLPEGINTINCWGFKYRTCAIWDKWHLGLGWFFRLQHELLLIGKKGKFIPTMFYEKRGKHSRKPDILYNILRENTREPRIDIFARENREGWDVWGNEV